MNAATWHLSNRQSLILSIAIFSIFVFVLMLQTITSNSGTITYPLDNAYTSMSIAKNLVIYHSWGLSGNGFVSSTSSILYPLILAILFKIFGIQTVMPFIVNFVTATFFLIVAGKWLTRQTVAPLAQLLILIMLIIFIPLPVVVMLGMEHSLQILFTFLFIYSFSDAATPQTSSVKSLNISWPVYLYAALLTSTRYEGVFPVFVACTLLLYRRQWLRAILLGIIALLPIILFGLYSLSKDNYIFPNPMLMKSTFLPTNWDDAWIFLKKGIFDRIFYAPVSLGTVAVSRILISIPLVYVLFRSRLRENSSYKSILAIVLGTVLLHVILANSILFYRYEAYLIAIFLPVTGALVSKIDFNKYWKNEKVGRFMAIFVVIILFFPLFWRVKKSIEDVPLSAINEYRQGYQLGNFLKSHYNQENVALNDIGVTSYYKDGKTLDLTGIGNIELAKAKFEKIYSIDYLLYVLQREKVKIVAVSARAYHPYLLEHWTLVASWSIHEVVPPADPDISFYAVSKADAPILRKNLQAYQPLLPSSVKVTYY